MVLSDPSPRVEAKGEDGAGGCEQDAKQYKLHHLSVKFGQHRVMVVRIAMKMINDFRPAGLTL